MNIVIFGPPLAGKGTHTKFLQNNYGFDVISTGSLLRGHMQDQTALGKKIKPVMDSGGLIDVDDIIGVIEDAYTKCTSTEGIVFDGTPRRVEEFEKLLDILENAGETIDKIIVLDVPENELYRRMNQRRNDMMAAGQNPRSDDSAEVLKDRLEKYRAESLPVIAEAHDYGMDVIYIDGNNDIDYVKDMIADAVDSTQVYAPSPGPLMP